ncbi:LOW QUALITY PROTEIN: alanine aminotransferase 1-like [Sarcoramphus papa]
MAEGAAVPAGKCQGGGNGASNGAGIWEGNGAGNGEGNREGNGAGIWEGNEGVGTGAGNGMGNEAGNGDGKRASIWEGNGAGNREGNGAGNGHTSVPRVTHATWQEPGTGQRTDGQDPARPGRPGTPCAAEPLTINPGPFPAAQPCSPAAPAPAPAMAAVGTSGGTGHPPSLVNPGSRHAPLSPLQSLLERAAAIEEELAQGEDKPFTEVICCHSGDAVAAGHQPLAFLRQVAAICAYPELLGAECMPADAKRRAGRILRHLQGGSPGAYNLEYVTDTVAEKVARYLEQRDGGIPSDPRCIVPCGGTAPAVVVSMARGPVAPVAPVHRGPSSHGASSWQDMVSLVVDEAAEQPTGVLVPVPGPPLHGAAAGLAGAVAVPYPLAEEQGWDVAGEAVRRVLRQARERCHPKVLCVVNPGDPTGHVLSQQSMEDIIRLVAEENLLLLADEVLQDNVATPGRPFLSFKRVLWEMGAPLTSTVQLVSFYSLSKGVGGGGFRAGFFELVNIDPSVLKCFYTWGMSVYPPILGQVMLDAAMEPPLPNEPSYPAFEEHRQGLRRDLAHNARLVQEVLGRAPGIRCRPVHGGARAFPRIQLPPRALRRARALGLEPDAFFCQKLLEATGIVVAPGSEFGQAEGTHHVGLSLLLPAERLERALLALARFHAAFLRDFS